MKEENKMYNKFAIIGIMIIIFGLLIFGSKAYAYGTWQGTETSGMPSNVLSSTGLMPQILAERKFTGNPDTTFPYTSWTTNISTGTVYCANNGTAVRFGEYDETRYFMDTVGYDENWDYSTFLERMRRMLRELAEEQCSSSDIRFDGLIESTYSIGYTQFAGPNDPDDSSKYAIEKDQALIPLVIGGDDRAAQRIAWARGLAEDLVAKIFDTLGEWDKPTDTEDESTNPDETQNHWDGNLVYGPQVVVMESSDGAEDGYKATAVHLEQSNNRFAYILTAMENSYNTLIHTKYSLSDIQTAHWLDVDHDGIRQSSLTQNGRVLFEQATQYQKFVDEDLAKFEGDNAVELDISQAQVIVNQNTKKYTIGPIYMTYPYYLDISYLKALYLETDTGETLVYDENRTDFDIYCGEYGISGSNGLERMYPATDTPFYIQFSASKTNYPKEIKIYANCEYLDTTHIVYNELSCKANVYQYYGYVADTGDFAMRAAWGTGSVTYKYSKWKESGYWDEDYDDEGNLISKDWVDTSHWVSGYTDQANIGAGGENHINDGVLILQPFVQMSVKPVKTLRAQPFTVALDGDRTYEIYDTYENPAIIDLTFELGGKVWVDGEAGKESEYDGIFNSGTDTPMSNVKVSLYQVDGLNGNLSGKYIDSMLTDGDGEYLFENQNAMYQYYVKFTYNGQYYQPTIYNVDRDDENWNNTSKGLDILEERDTFNAQFKEIGSAPENTVDCDTACEIHTREELEDAGLIDEFGNIIGRLDSKGNRSSSDDYVNYCMMDSYTCDGTSTKDLYPGVKVFVNDTYLNNLSNTEGVLSFVGASEIELLYADPDLMHHINQGYVLRELVDLALRKDVYEATLEINGKTEVYTYNKREGLETDANGNSYWEIETRVSDGYYDYEYSRELYREDYDYKIDNYVMEDTTTSLDNLGLSEDSELKIYVTYKYTIRNRSEGIAAAVTEIVDYYDEDYSYVQERSYLGDNNGNKIGEIYLKDDSRYGSSTETQMSAGYKNLYITGDESYSNENLDSNTKNTFPLSDPDDNKDVYFYVTFIVNKDGNRNNILDEVVSDGTAIGVGKENIAEINGYKTYYGIKAEAPNANNSQTEKEYETGDIAGIVDTNSTPGNLDPADVPKDGAIKYENFENDTDKAPNIRIILNRDNVRTVQGTVWEDARTETVELAQVGNGLRESETGINGVRVQLVEIRNGKDGNTYEYIWKEVYSGNTDSIEPIINNSGIIPNYTIDTSNANGQYKFTSFAPGNYIVRFIYGSDESSVLGTTYTNYNTGEENSNPVTQLYNDEVAECTITNGSNGYSASSGNIGINKNSYNGQDYKSTSYQVGINNGTGAYENNSTTSYVYNFSEADGGLYSDAKDIMNEKSSNVINIAPKREYLVNCANSRKQVEGYSNEDEINSKAEILSSFENLHEYNYTKYTATEMKNLLDELMRNTFMISESGTIDVNFEYNRTGEEASYTNTSNSGHNNIGSSNYEMCGYYILDNLDLGLQQRPKAQLKVTKQITNIKVTLANNSVLFDASDKATNVLWIDHKAHGQDTENTYKTDKNYSNSMMLNPVVRQQATNKGKVQLTMDEELMHGSTIQITYAITVANVGEVDYNENQFYYTGTVGNTSTIVKTNPRALVDYVGTQVNEYGVIDDATSTRNNLQFIAAQNPDWTVVSANDLISNGFVNSKLSDNVNKYSDGHIVITYATSKDLKPIIADQSNSTKIEDVFEKDPLHALETVNASESVSGVQLVLSQMITQDSSSDDRIYNNLTELIVVKNKVGRRMTYSVVGNQDPTIEPREIDADDAQEVVILPPFGQKYIYYILGTAVAVILIAGILVTISVVKKKK